MVYCRRRKVWTRWEQKGFRDSGGALCTPANLWKMTKIMGIIALKSVLRPPEKPLEIVGNDGWELVEQRVGARLPEDYKAFIECYGTGRIGAFLVVLNPFSTNRFINLIDRSRVELEGLIALRQKWPQYYLHDVFPSPAGLLPFASTDNGEILYWRTACDPEQWTVVVYESRGPKHYDFDGRMTDFLAALLTRAIQCDVLPRTFPSGVVSFVPGMSGELM